MNTIYSRRNQLFTLLECLIIAFLPMIGFGLGCAAMPNNGFIISSVSEGYAKSLMILSIGFYAFPAFFAQMAFETLRGHGFSASSPPDSFLVVSACIQSLVLGFALWLIVGRRKTPAKMLRLVGVATAVYLTGNALVGCFVYAISGSGREAYHRLMTADHPALLNACRDMMANRHLYTNDWSDTVTRDGAYIGISQEQIESNPNVPPIIRGMNPICIRVEKKRVLATLPGPPRLYFIGYSEGSEQTGTVRLIDGLWFFNGEWDSMETAGLDH